MKLLVGLTAVLFGLLVNSEVAATSKSATQATKVTRSKTTRATTGKQKRASASSRKGKRSRKTAGNWRKHGQQKIDAQRTREIQEALIRQHYLDGEANGQWDERTQKAMQRYQAANGWQSKMVPDSRALIKLGLGPDHEHLLNPESAMTSQPAAPTNSPAVPPSAAHATAGDLPQN